MISPGSRAPVREAAPPPDELMVVPYEGDGDAWDRFVEGAEGATFAHRYGWRGVMEDVMGHPTRYSVATDARGRWHGVLPLARVESVFGRYLVSMPHLDAGGPLGTPAARWVLAEDARDHAAAEDVDLLELRTRVATSTPLQVSRRRRFLAVDLGERPARGGPAGEERAPPVAAGRGGRDGDGGEVREGPAGLEAFVGLYGARMRDRGLPVPPPGFFEAAAEAFGRRVRFAALHRGPGPVAALCAFVGNDELEIAWSAVRPTGPPSAAARLHRAVVRARTADGGIRRVWLAAGNPDAPPRDWWARRWATEEVAAPWLQWRPAARPASDRPLYRAAAWLWSHLPDPVAERLGPSLARPRA